MLAFQSVGTMVTIMMMIKGVCSLTVMETRGLRPGLDSRASFRGSRGASFFPLPAMALVSLAGFLMAASLQWPSPFSSLALSPFY